MAQVRMREGAVLIKNCSKMIQAKDAELEKVTQRLEKEIKKSVARSVSGSRGALVGVKSVNRTKLQMEKIVQVKAYLEEVIVKTKRIMIEGKAEPAKMILPTDMEKLKKEIKKIEKQVEKSDSTTTISTIEDSERFLMELQEVETS